MSTLQLVWSSDKLCWRNMPKNSLFVHLLQCNILLIINSNKNPHSTCWKSAKCMINIKWKRIFLGKNTILKIPNEIKNHLGSKFQILFFLLCSQILKILHAPHVNSNNKRYKEKLSLCFLRFNLFHQKHLILKI